MKGLVKNYNNNPLFKATHSKIQAPAHAISGIDKQISYFGEHRKKANLISYQQAPVTELHQKFEPLFQIMDDLDGDPSLVGQAKLKLKDAKDAFKNMGMEGLSGNRLTKKLADIPRDLDFLLAEALYKKDPKFEQLLDEVIGEDQPKYYQPVFSGGKWRWDYKDVTKDELIERFEQSWKESVLSKDDLSRLRTTEKVDMDNNRDDQPQEGFLPRVIKKAVDMGILELLREMRSWGLSPIPLLAILPNIQFGDANDEVTGLKKYKGASERHNAFTIPPGSTQTENVKVYVPWPYFRTAFKASGKTDVMGILKAGKKYALYVGIGETHRKHRRIIKNYLLDVEKYLGGRNDEKPIKPEANSFKKAELVKASDFYYEGMQKIVFKIRKQKMPRVALYREEVNETVRYEVYIPKRGTITILHELLHAYSLTGCNKSINRSITDSDGHVLTDREHYIEETFVQIWDRVIELIIIMTQMEKERIRENRSVQQMTKEYQDAYYELGTYLAVLYEEFFELYMPDDIKICFENLKMWDRVNELLLSIPNGYYTKYSEKIKFKTRSNR